VTLRAILRTRLRDDEAAAEVANDVLFAVIDAMRLGRVREGGSLPAFVHGVARNMANNYLRANVGRRLEEPMAPDFDFPTTSHDPNDVERLDAAKDALDRLEEIDRNVLLLVLVEGLKPTEIGLRLGLSAEVVRARKCRAIKRLTAQLASNVDKEGR
jgi:RNA polymerase sigma-70 factor (ECF subfamily)